MHEGNTAQAKEITYELKRVTAEIKYFKKPKSGRLMRKCTNQYGTPRLTATGHYCGGCYIRRATEEGAQKSGTIKRLG